MSVSQSLNQSTNQSKNVFSAPSTFFLGACSLSYYHCIAHIQKVGWFPVLTRAYDNNGRCPRQKLVPKAHQNQLKKITMRLYIAPLCAPHETLRVSVSVMI